MSRYVSPGVRRLVADRAEHLCEYCLIGEDDTFFGCEVEHIISIKHGGSSEPDNPAYARVFCNRQKGSDIGSLSQQTRELSRFYHPRADRWADHFRLDGELITPLSVIGEVTARILQFNIGERLLERRLLRAAGRYPSESALTRIEGH
jgi:hypothetical protein